MLIPTSGKVLRAGKELVEEGVQLAARNGDELGLGSHRPIQQTFGSYDVGPEGVSSGTALC